MKIKLNSAGVRQLLRVEVRDDIEARAKRVADQAGAGLDDPAGMTVIEAGDDRRARYIVLTTTAEAVSAEATQRVLTAAMDAAR